MPINFLHWQAWEHFVPHSWASHISLQQSHSRLDEVHSFDHKPNIQQWAFQTAFRVDHNFYSSLYVFPNALLIVLKCNKAYSLKRGHWNICSLCRYSKKINLLMTWWTLWIGVWTGYQFSDKGVIKLQRLGLFVSNFSSYRENLHKMAFKWHSMHLIYVKLSQSFEKSRVTKWNNENFQSSEAQVKVKCFLKLTKDS